MLRKVQKFIASLSLLAAAVLPLAAEASPGCVGKMWNPLTDLDFRNMGGIKIVGFPLMDAPKSVGEPPKHKADPICFCEDGLNSGFGFGLTFWMPSYINDVARQAGCLGFLSGINILPGFMSLSSGQEYNAHSPRKDGVTNMQVHWVYADVAAIAGKALFEKCNAVTGSMKIGYLTEPDFIFQNDVYSAIMTPQVSLLAEAPLLSQMACGFESMANTLGDWQDWGICAWKGTRMPLTANAIAKDSAQVTNMDVTIKYLTRSALLGLTMRTMGDDAVCKPKYQPFYDPFQHRYQWAFPAKVTTRYNIDMIRWGTFIKDDGQASMISLNADAAAIANMDSTIAVGQAGAPSSSGLSMAEGIVSRLPKPLNFPSREAGYMQVWEARQCCLMVLTIENVIEMIASNLIPQGSLLEQLYNAYKVADAVYQAVTDPVGAALGFIGDGLGAVFDGVGSSVGDVFSDGVSGAVSGIGNSLGLNGGNIFGSGASLEPAYTAPTPLSIALADIPLTEQN
ncbi:conjugal transfer pilus assembly protein TraU [Novimethylophilus kurashikiensis]|uniref:Conjugal transfer pilus assembly protein TraU n=1 Tax=Novimethylophilus kurashikiensis TaxID=1825523 RepID=A0A2R5F9L7_9PROT|nr:TraU family protein [Novimethylophilus kurashikiensis]GBG14509.1 conjugal transfer pilus assembly protein TraU [Novimethylophilus kurashikiensis]